MKRIVLPLLLGLVLLLPNFHACGQDADRIQKMELTKFPPVNLCPFTVDIYPKNSRLGDPIYIRMNFQNNTDNETFAIAEALDYVDYYILGGIVAFHFMKSDGVILPWGIFDGYSDYAMFAPRIWQRIKPGEKGITQYMAFTVPGGLGVESRKLSSQRTIFNHIGRGNMDHWDGVRDSLAGTSGHLLAIIHNDRYVFVPDNTGNHFNPSRKQATLMALSPQIRIMPRNRAEVDFLKELNSKPGNLQKHDLELAIPKLTPGTLKNKFKYELLLLELEETTYEYPRLETRILEVLDRIEIFLNSLHEIERENLKRSFQKRDYIEGRMRNQKTRLNEVFGDKHTRVTLPVK